MVVDPARGMSDNHPDNDGFLKPPFLHPLLAACPHAEWITEVRFLTSRQFETLEAIAGFSLSKECRRAINEAVAVSFIAGAQTFNQDDKIAVEAVARTGFAFVKAVCDLQEKHPGLDFDLATLGADKGNNSLWADPRGTCADERNMKLALCAGMRREYSGARSCQWNSRSSLWRLQRATFPVLPTNPLDIATTVACMLHTLRF